MITAKYIYFWTFLWAMSTAVCCVIEGSHVSSQNALVNTLTGYSILNVNEVDLFTYFSLGIGFLVHGVPNLLLFNYSFLQVDVIGQYFRWLLVAILDPGLVFMLYQLIFHRRT
jgi:hypothetical protein